MTEEEARQLREAYAKREEEAIQKDRRIEDLEGRLMSALLRIEELERRLAKDSHNSSKPPSSDGFKHQGKKHPASSKTTGGQAGHPGHTLEVVETPDEVVIHRPSHCEAQYGPGVQALAVYFSQYQLLPMERIGEVFEDLLSCRLSDGTLATWIQKAARTLGPTMLLIKRLLLTQKLDHVDETGGRVKGLLHWFHVNATQWLKLYHWHRQRGQRAMDTIGILPEYTGRAIHDRLSSYDHYGCAHSVCGAHLLRDCLLIAERDHQPWAQQMYNLLERMSHTTARFRAAGSGRLPQEERDALVLQYFEILQQGFAAHRILAPPPDACLPKKPGRRKQDDAKNLLDALLARAEQALAFLDDLAVPFSNNQAERDLRMIKVQQKISGTFRSSQGATAFCIIRSYLSTMRKQGRPMLAAMAAVFRGSPFPIAWEPGT